MVDAIIARWQRDGLKHKLQIAALRTFRLSLHIQSEAAISAVVKSIIIFCNKMQEANAIKTMAGEMPKTSQLVDLIKRRLESDPI